MSNTNCYMAIEYALWKKIKKIKKKHPFSESVEIACDNSNKPMLATVEILLLLFFFTIYAISYSII